MDIFLTIDAEVWPAVNGWPASRRLDPKTDDLDTRIATDLYGATKKADYGIGYQIRTFNACGLKATFFLEALAWGVLGELQLARAIASIQEGGHEIQLHLHTEWLSDLHTAALPARYRQFMHQFSQQEQVALIVYGQSALAAAGARPICAFRAGSYGANLDTLAALATAGIAVDSSFNPCSPIAHCQLRSDCTILQQSIHRVTEYPIAAFEDYPGHLRPAQLCACSTDELTSAIEGAWRAGSPSFVVVLHSFELIRRAKGEGLAHPDWLNIRRFHALCEYLAKNSDRFRCTTFSQADRLRQLPRALPVTPRTGVVKAVWRQIEQAAARVF